MGDFPGELGGALPAEREIYGGELVLIDEMFQEVMQAIGPRPGRLEAAAPFAHGELPIIALEVAFLAERFRIRKDLPLGLKKKMKRNWAMGFFDHGDRPLVDLPDPCRELLDVRDRGAQSEDPDLGWREKKRFFPDGAALDVIQIMDFVKNDPADLLDAFGIFKKTIPVNFGGHDKERGIGIDRDVPGQDADDVLTESFLEVAELLIAQGLDRSGVNDSLPAGKGFFDRFFSDQRFSRACGRGNEQGMLFFDPLNGFDLKRVQLEGPALAFVFF